MAPFLLLITLMSVSGTLASEKSACDEAPNNGTCNQFGCDQQPCSIVCGKMSSFDRCEQQCNGSTCTSMVCSTSVQSCLQQCPSGAVCQSFDCNAVSCFQTCRGGDCGEMTCNKGTTTCEQTDGKSMSCSSSQTCQQICSSGQKCNMTCSSDVRECTQSCEGECFYQCAAQNCQLSGCNGGNCKKIESPTSSASTVSTVSTTSTTSKTTTGGTGAPPQVDSTAVFGLIIAFVNFL